MVQPAVGSAPDNLTSCMNLVLLTKLLQHFVTFVQDEMLQIFQRKFLAPDEGQDSAWGSNNNVGTVGLQDLLVLCYGETSEEHSNLRNNLMRI